MADTFQKINWKHDVFDAEYLTKKTKEEQEYEEVVRTLSSLRLSAKTLKETRLMIREYIFKKMDLERKDVPGNIRKYYLKR